MRGNSLCESPPQTSQVSTQFLCAILCNCVVVLQRRTHIHKHVVGVATITIYQGTNIYELKHGITMVVQQRFTKRLLLPSTILKELLCFSQQKPRLLSTTILQELLCFS